MIKIKAVDRQNIFDVCELSANQESTGKKAGRCSYCNAISIAEAKYNSEMHPNAIYNNDVLIGFFMYKRTETQAEKATICRFMVDDRSQQKGLAEKALEHVLRGLKIQGVRKVVLIIDNANENANNLYLSSGFHFTGQTDKTEYRYELEL